jgi:hypothetical protein
VISYFHLNRDFSEDYKQAAARGKDVHAEGAGDGADDDDEYDFENPNDASYCPADEDGFVGGGDGGAADKDDEQGEIFEFAAAGHAGAYVGDNLVEAPQTVSTQLHPIFLHFLTIFLTSCAAESISRKSWRESRLLQQHSSKH